METTVKAFLATKNRKLCKQAQPSTANKDAV
jgi:hypothetical protein